VPEAEGCVGAWRTVHDQSAGQGVPAHVTLLFPFRSVDRLDGTVFERVEAIAQAGDPFHFTLARIARFDDTLYLAPEPAAPFVALTHALAAVFPDHPPYGGSHAEVVPHLTVARGAAAVLDAVEAALRTTLPRAGIAARAGEILLIADDTGRWRTIHRFPLGASDATIARGGNAHRPSRHEGGES